MFLAMGLFLWIAAVDLRTGRIPDALSLPLLAFQMVFRVRATKEVLRHRGLLTETRARAAGPVLDVQDQREIVALLADMKPLFERDVPKV